jgi:hypothetical protein
MTSLVIPSSAVHEWNAYEECGVLILGLRCGPEAGIGSVIFQIDGEGSDQQRDAWGMYAELDEIGHYAVHRFSFDRTACRLDVEFAPQAFGDIESLSATLPPIDVSKIAMVIRMAATFDAYPPRRLA